MDTVNLAKNEQLMFRFRKKKINRAAKMYTIDMKSKPERLGKKISLRGKKLRNKCSTRSKKHLKRL